MRTCLNCRWSKVLFLDLFRRGARNRVAKKLAKCKPQALEGKILSRSGKGMSLKDRYIVNNEVLLCRSLKDPSMFSYSKRF